MTLPRPDATFPPQQGAARDAPVVGLSNRSPASERETGEATEGELADADVAARVLGFGLVLGALAFAAWGWLSILL